MENCYSARGESLNAQTLDLDFANRPSRTIAPSSSSGWRMVMTAQYEHCQSLYQYDTDVGIAAVGSFQEVLGLSLLQDESKILRSL